MFKLGLQPLMLSFDLQPRVCIFGFLSHPLLLYLPFICLHTPIYTLKTLSDVFFHLLQQVLTPLFIALEALVDLDVHSEVPQHL